MLTICADGINRCQPLLIFHGSGKVMKNEGSRYHPDIRVIFNAKAYSSEEVTLEWLYTDLLPAMSQSSPNLPRLLTLDVFAGQKTLPVLQAMRDNNIISAFIPEGCTGYVQPLDTTINKMLKDHILEIMDEELEKNPTLWSPEGSNISELENNHDQGHPKLSVIGERRIMISQAVGKAWKWLHKFHSHNIQKAFQQCGISVAANGLEDQKIDIRGIDNKSINLHGWETGGLYCNLDSTGCTGIGGLNFNDPDSPEVEEYISYLATDRIDGSRIYVSSSS